MQANAKCLDVVPDTSARTLLLSQQDGLQQIRFDIPRRPDDLASRIVEGFVQTYEFERGLPVSREHRDAIEQIAIAIQLMADRGPIFPLLFLLSTLPTGAGKTTLMVEAVKAIVADPAYAHIGIVICVNYLKQIPILARDMGLEDEQFAVRTGKRNKEYNELGRTSLMNTEKDKKTAHHQAQVLFTTHAKVRAVALHQRSFAKSPFFQFNGVTRQVRIWDEAILPADPIVLTTGEIGEYVRRLKGWDEAKAAAMLSDWLVNLSNAASDSIAKMPPFHLQMPFPPDDVDNDLEVASPRDKELYESELAQKMWLLAGHKVRVHRDVHSGTTAITYRENLPLELAPLLILDAGGELAMTYHAWGEGRGNLRQLPSVAKRYRNLTTHYWDHRAGKTAHRDNEILDELALGVATALDQIRKENDQEKMLIIHRLHEKPYADITERIRECVIKTGRSAEGLCFLHYGRHTAINDFQDFKHVIVVGLLQYGEADYQAIWRAAKGVSALQSRKKWQSFALERSRHTCCKRLDEATGRRTQSGTRCPDCACYSLHRPGAGTADGARFSHAAANRGATRRWSRPGDARTRQTGGRRCGNPFEDHPTASSAATRPSTQAYTDSAVGIASVGNSSHVASTTTTA